MGKRIDQFKRVVATRTVEAIETQESEFTLQNIKAQLPLKMRLFGGEIIRQTINDMIAFGQLEVTQTIHPISLPNESHINNLQPPVDVYSRMNAPHATQSS